MIRFQPCAGSAISPLSGLLGGIALLAREPLAQNAMKRVRLLDRKSRERLRIESGGRRSLLGGAETATERECNRQLVSGRHTNTLCSKGTAVNPFRRAPGSLAAGILRVYVEADRSACPVLCRGGGAQRRRLSNLRQPRAGAHQRQCTGSGNPQAGIRERASRPGLSSTRRPASATPASAWTSSTG